MKKLALIGLVLGVVDVGVPYLFLKDVGSFWASFLFWIAFAVIVLGVGIGRVSQWSE